MFEVSLADRFRAMVEHHPDSLAIDDQRAALTYRELDRQANAVANVILSHPSAAGCRIILLLDQGADAGVATLAALKCGAAYVPLDPGGPAAALRNMIATADAAFLITHRHYFALASTVVPVSTRVLVLEDLKSARDSHDPQLAVSPDALAYIYFTSGSTGVPKGVCDTHRNVLHNVWRYTTLLHIDHRDRLTLLQAPHFSGAVSSFFCAVLNGATSLPFDIPHEGLAPIPEWMRTKRVTIFHGVPAIFREVITGGSFPDLRCVRLEGDQATRRDIELFRRHCAPGTLLANGLGATECGLVRQWRIHAATEIPEGPIPIGTAVPDMAIDLLGEDGAPVADGETGQIAVRSRYLATGYWRQPGLTAAKFLSDPRDSRSRIYLTGDRGRMLPGGLLQFLGRTHLDGKLHGRWIDLARVERTLQLAPGVHEAVAAIREDAAGTSRLVAYVVPAAGTPATIDRLRAHVALAVPEFMVPTAWVFLPHLPLTRNLKVDRAALPKPECTRTLKREDFVAPRDEAEMALARIWSDVLHVEPIGAHDNFFSLGGDSLLAMQVSARVRQTMTMQLRVQAIFRHPTIAELARQLESIDDVVPAETTSPPPAPRDSSLPLSFAQQRLWFIHRFAESSLEYHVLDAVRLRGPLNRDALELAVNELIARHDSFRACFDDGDGEPRQRIMPAFRVELPVEDLAALTNEEQQSAVAASLRRLRDTPFDLHTGPLFRVRLIRLGRDDHILGRAWHHIIADGWSGRVFHRELSELYAGASRGESNPRPTSARQYAEFASWQRQTAAGPEWEQHLAYWRSHLRDAPQLDLPADRPRPARQTFTGAEHTFVLPAALAKQIEHFGAREQVTPFMTLLAAFQILLARYSGQDDIVIGTAAANRPRVEWEEVIGLFVNLIVLRTDFSSRPSFRDSVSRVRRVVLEAFEHQDIPFDRLVEALNPNRDLSRHPLFQVVCAMQPAPTAGLALPDIAVERHSVPAEFTPYDLELNLWPESDTWIATFVYRTDLFCAPTIARMSGHYVTLLTSLLAAPELPVHELPMVTAGERRQLIETWNDTAAEFPRDVCVHQLIEAQTARTPDAIAITYGDAFLTYAQLDARAEKFARVLSASGVKPGTFVGLCVERSLEMVIGVLAILKAGGAYVPVDPQAPAHRAGAMLHDAGANVLLTQRSLAPVWAGFTGTTVWFDDPVAIAASAAASPIPTPDSAAYVIFTSGSTGRPKGVVVEHRSIVNLLHATQRCPGFSAEEVLVAVCTIAFDFSVLELFLPLSVGARIVVASDDVRSRGDELLALIERSNATIVMATPATWRALVDAGLHCPRLRAVVGGEELPPSLARAIRAGCRELWNVYGPTENSVISLVARIEGDGVITIGRPIANTAAYLVDAHEQLVPVGVPGELLVGGAGVARGYLQQPELTGLRFIPDRFSNVPGARLYRTGDRCRRLEDGSIEFLGRLDEQVKLRGFRIELGEIEHVLRAMPGVHDAVVALRNSASGEKILAAYLVPSEPDTVVSLETVHDFLRPRLPAYMWPAACLTLAALPLSSSQKINRAALPDPADVAISEVKSAPTQSLLELELTRLWQRLFQRAAIGRDDNFFALGGHSLLAARVVAEVEKWIGRRLSASMLFEAPTIARLARVLRVEATLPPHNALVPLQPQGSAPPLFCVHGWGGDVFGFLDLARQLAPERPVYGIRAVGIDDDRPHHTSVEEMAAHYGREIRSLRPQGPYHLIGHSAGGWIAFAVAHELISHGASVATLALLDTEPLFQLPLPVRLQVLVPFLVRRLGLHLHGGRPDRRAEFVRYIVQKLHALRGHLVADPGTMSHPDYFATVVQRYRPRPYPGGLVLFQAADFRQNYVPFWRHLVRGGVKTCHVPGTHHTLLSAENAPALAVLLRQVLAQSESAVTETSRRQ